MPRYRYCFIGEDGNVIGVEMFDATDDGVARAGAEQMIARVGCPAVEVWSQGEMIYRAETCWRRKRPIDRRTKKLPHDEKA